MSRTRDSTLLGNVLKRSDETVVLQPDATYREVTVKMWGKGVVLRGVLTGAEIASARRFVARSGQFILSRIDARNGALGVVPTELDGAVVTNDFPLFFPDPERIDPSYLGWLSRSGSFVELCRRASEGTTNRVRLQEDRFLSFAIDLPPLAEQRRIVAEIDELAALVSEARDLRRKADEQTKMLMARATAALLDTPAWERKPLGDILAEPPRNGLSPKSEASSGGRPMLRINAVSSSPTRYVNLTAAKSVEVTDKEAAPFELRDNDVFIVRYNGDLNRVAKPAIFKGNQACRVVFPDKLMRLRPQITKMTPDFLVFALRARSVREQVEQLGKTTAGNIGISGTDAKSFVVPVPPISEQDRIIFKLDILQTKIHDLTRWQTETAVELDALLPTILNRSFNGA